MAAAAVLGLGVGVLLLTCNGDPPAEPPATDPVILRAADVEVRRSEIAALDDYLQELDPTLGEMTRRRAVLDLYLLPLKLAQRDFEKERAVQRKRAEALARVLGDSASCDDLAAQGRRFPDAGLRQGLVRRVMALPEARWAFAEAHVGQVSPILETPRGYTILATLEKRPGQTKHYDVADVWVVPFRTHPQKAYLDWLPRAKGSLAGKLTFIHEDYKEALPHWLRQ
ncbi:MAG: hypothetical protein ACYST0_08030 [Planctomycetota bacterium]|jgi:hypothetical protein